MDIDAYLKRINYTGGLGINAQTLHDLHVAHLLTVPFENLDIHLKRPIQLDDAALFQKIVERKHGGFCYELNGLFAWLLRELGFDVQMLSAGVMGHDEQFSPEFDHMTLLVSLEQPWLADVGFGDSFVEPLCLEDTGLSPQGRYSYRVDRHDPFNTLMQREQGGNWEPQYRFRLQPHPMSDFHARCVYQQTSPQSHFTQRRICTLATLTGRITLTDMRLITTINGTRNEQMLTDQQEYLAVLRDQFGIVVE